MTDEDKPECYQEAMEDERKKKPYNPMQDEMDSLHENYTYNLVELPTWKRALRNKWVFYLKIGEDGNIPK